ncbi:hypothetical protein SAMN04487939_10633 [Lysobacter sp. yr284]|nr:hypothetical protein SAMN04487939_10633 [Lysobacter sp. yr284]
MRPALLALALACACTQAQAQADAPAGDASPQAQTQAVAAMQESPQEPAPEATAAPAGTSSATQADPSSDRDLRWTGTASGAVLAASGSRDLDDADARFGAAARVRSELRSGAWRGLVEAVAGNRRLGYDDASPLRQAFAEYTAGPLQLRAGRQIVAWGRADRLNPTDNLSPRNMRALVSDIDEDRIGVDLVSARVQWRERWSLTALHVPRLPASVLPGSLWKPLPGVRGDRVRAAGATGALRLDYAGAGLDASLSVLDGYSTLPAFARAALPRLSQARVRVIGADFSASLGDRWGLRGEWAQTRFDGPPPPGLGDQRYAVLGLERHFDGGWLGLAQYVQRRAERPRGTAALPAPLLRANRAIWFQSQADSEGLYLGLTRAPLEGDLSGDIGVLQSLDGHGRAWFANLEYRLDDSWSLLARLQHFDGPADSDLGALRKDRLGLLELRRSWGWQR